MSNSEKRIEFDGGTASTKIPRFELIPRPALEALANRMELGLELHKDKAWNALSGNFESGLTPEFVLARLGHGIDHSYKAIAKLQARLRALQLGHYVPEDEDDEDDAGALMFAGAVLACYKKLKKG